MARAAGERRSEALKQRRIEAGKLFAKGATQSEVARRLGVSRVSALRWYRIWRRGGRRGLAVAARLGRPRKLGPRELKRISRVLLQGPQAQGYGTELWTLPRIAEVVERETGVRYHPGHVWRVLRGLGWSLQRPTLRARERDEQAIARWQREVWPRVKKTPGAARR
ncbi:MAG TPA: winged helix-turn-helix domain-containing protein [Vicinamibacteria bacterium]|nr:winged helix-turn-helix domain-containing protein [Vicinamibacteria bacterium]